MHLEAINLSPENKQTLAEIYSSTLLGRAFKNPNSSAEIRASKFIAICYMMANKELPFRKFPAICISRRRQGVLLGKHYLTEPKCSKIITLIGEVFEQKQVEVLNTRPYFSIIVDGSTNVTATEQQINYILYLTEAGETSCKFIQISDVSNATAEGLHQYII